MSGSFLPSEQTTSVKPVDGADKTAQGDQNSTSNHLLQPYLGQTLAPAADRKTGAQLDTKPTDWTIVADLTILFDQTGNHGHMGAEDKAALLKELKDSTKGKSVSIVLESITADGKDVPGQPLSSSKEPYGAQMIVLRDGQEYDISSGPSKQLKGDLQDVLDFALKNQPSKNVALAINAHGMGDQGILGGTQEQRGRENGRMTANDLTDTIKASLTKANRDKLDVVDMDSCLMGEMGVVRSMSAVTRQLVASEKTEIVSKTDAIDGQNLTNWVSKVIAKPTMSGAEVAHEIVDQANRNINGRVDHEGTPTLVSFDTKYVDELSSKMNELGKALVDVSKNPSNADQINQAIDGTDNLAAARQYGPPASSSAAKFDIKQFMGSLQFRLDAKTISDPTGELKKAITDVDAFVDDRSKLITTVHLPYEGLRSNPFQKAQTSTGLSVFLPGRDTRENPSLKKADFENLQKMETGTADSDWNTFLNSVRKPVHRLGDPPIS